jgi:hypothetical protein
LSKSDATRKLPDDLDLPNRLMDCPARCAQVDGLDDVLAAVDGVTGENDGEDGNGRGLWNPGDLRGAGDTADVDDNVSLGLTMVGKLGP